MLILFILKESPFLNDELFDDPGHHTGVVFHGTTDVTWRGKEVK